MNRQQSDENGLRRNAADVLRAFEAGRLLPKAEAVPHLRGLLESRIDELSCRLTGTHTKAQ
ncbi:hypothetical protein [Azospirillum soli]|uniref:hypothetical protein n=1 Tax=Azospirillum soli TaxID=1304799 RepID=UPI001AEACB2E|nr:hypothetical protein [Azospirillum soli]MBP2316479.1 hypothetical protein [Azospirillum soli]